MEIVSISTEINYANKVYHQKKQIDVRLPVHICDVCGKKDNWDKNWYWFGSAADLENGEPIIKLCSDDCKNTLTKGKMKQIIEAKRQCCKYHD